MNLREVKAVERKQLLSRGCIAECWDKVLVAEDFTPSQLYNCRLKGDVHIGQGAQLINCTVSNYSIGAHAVVDSVTALECRQSSSFGNGVRVATLNECGGRSVAIFDEMTAQQAYIATIYQHRKELQHRINNMVDAYSESKSSTMGRVGANSKIIGARFIREVAVGDNVEIEGASILENGTVCDGAFVGVDVRARDFIAVENSKIDNGSTLERCFVGERVIISNGFTAVDSLFFANTHCENGEAASIFAGPYTVSHHKSSLLIAGMFSFFNAGSGSNQSNHLFKCGPVHQGVHMRGCKFGSSAYVMLPAVDGAYTSVIGSHNSHHDTSDFPFSYLLNKDGRSTLLPAANLTSYGYVRDIAKWVARDKRTLKRDELSLEEHNPYIVGAMVNAVNTTNTLFDKNPDADQYIHNKVIIKAASLKRGLTMYNKAIAASLGAMLSKDSASRVEVDGRGKWLDVAGQYIAKSYVDRVLDAVEGGEIDSLSSFAAEFKAFAENYNAYAYSWAVSLFGQLLGSEPTEEQISSAIVSATRAQEELAALANRDMKKDCTLDMSISYGLDSEDSSEREADFRAVRSLD